MSNNAITRLTTINEHNVSVTSYANLAKSWDEGLRFNDPDRKKPESIQGEVY